MFTLYGFSTQNSLKALYVLEEIGIEFEFSYVDLLKREQLSDSFRQKTPFRKVPLLEHDGEFLFESGAICRYAANVTNSPLYPEDKLKRARVDQWLDFFSCHLGRWLNTLFFEQVIKSKVGLGDPDEKACEEAVKFAHVQFKILDKLLEDSKWIANDVLSIADLCAFAYIEQVNAVDFPLNNYPNVQDWFDRMKSLDSIDRARARLPS